MSSIGQTVSSCGSQGGTGTKAHLPATSVCSVVSLDLLAIANTRGFFVLLNTAWERVPGYRREELMAKRFLDFVHPDDLEITRKAFSALISQHEVIHFENRYLAGDGTYRSLEWTSAPAGDLIYAAARDLSEGLKAEAEDQQRREELAQKKEKLRLEPLDLSGLIQEVVALIRGDSLLRGLSIDMDLSPDLPTICGDGIQLQQVIINLILNGAAAMKNTAAGQRMMTVRTGMPDSGTVKVSVTDYGTGIDENTIDRLFEPFYTTKPLGLGMGLSISQTIIRSHGGILEASNNPEGGATFSFTLPACEKEPS